MNQHKETKKKLLISAKKEFLAKGYAKASLRNICKQAKVTTGALYFFFDNKEDLFAHIVDKPLAEILNIMQEHFADELADFENTNFDFRDESKDFIVMRDLIRCLYAYRDELLLIITKASGSKYENILDVFIEMVEQHLTILSNKYCDQLGKEQIPQYIIHWLSHLGIDTIVYMITHEEDEQKALSYSDITAGFFISGWTGMIDATNMKK